MRERVDAERFEEWERSWAVPSDPRAFDSPEVDEAEGAAFAAFAAAVNG